VTEEGSSSRKGVVASEPMGHCGPVWGRMPVDGIQCPEGTMYCCVVVYQLLHQGEVDWWCWSGQGRWHGDRGKDRGW